MLPSLFLTNQVLFYSLPKPNYDLVKVFFVVLRGPSWPFVDKKKVFFAALRG